MTKSATSAMMLGWSTSFLLGWIMAGGWIMFSGAKVWQVVQWYKVVTIAFRITLQGMMTLAVRLGEAMNKVRRQPHQSNVLPKVLKTTVLDNI